MAKPQSKNPQFNMLNPKPEKKHFSSILITFKLNIPKKLEQKLHNTNLKYYKIYLYLTIPDQFRLGTLTSGHDGYIIYRIGVADGSC